jgi:RNA polymerase sigma-70 factor, ECF subfamily
MTEDQPQTITSGDTASLIAAIAQRRCRESFAALFIRFAPKVKGYLLQMRCNEQVSEELAQETFLNIWRKAAQFDPGRANPEAWIYAIVRNLYFDVVRHERRPSDPQFAELLYEQLTPEQQLKAVESEQLVRAAIDALPTSQAEIMRLAFFEGCTHTQIAEMLCLPLGTVKSRIRLATTQLRATLDDLL